MSAILFTIKFSEIIATYVFKSAKESKKVFHEIMILHINFFVSENLDPKKYLKKY